MSFACLPEYATEKTGSAGRPYLHVTGRPPRPGPATNVVRRRRQPGNSSSPGRTCSAATGATRQATKAALDDAAGSRLVTSPSATPTASTGSAAAARTCTSPAVRTCIPAEVEEALIALRSRSRKRPWSASPDQRWGETGLAFVVLAPGPGRVGRGPRRATAARGWPATRCLHASGCCHATAEADKRQAGQGHAAGHAHRRLSQGRRHAH